MAGFDFAQFLGLGSKAPTEQDPYASIRPLLRQYATGGFPGWQQQWQQQWKQLMPQIQEQYQAKRGLGAGSTPEVAALGQAGAGLMGQLSQQDLMGRLQALMGFGRTPMGFRDVTTGGQNLWSTLGPLVAQMIGSGGG